MRKLIIALTLSIATLAIAAPIATTQTRTFCQECALQCTNDAYYVMSQCTQSGGSWPVCEQKYSQTLNSCNAVFCNYGGGCNLPTNY